MSDTTSGESPEYPTIERVYVGRRNDVKGAVVYAYMAVDPEEGRGEGWYKKPLVSGHAVGSVIRLTYSDESRTTYWVGGEHRPTVVRLADVSKETLLEWQAKDVAAYQAKAQADAMSRVIRETNHLDQYIDMLAFAAKSMTTNQRAAFARYVAERIR